MSNPPARKTYFGIAAIVTGIFAVLFLGANYVAAYLNISPAEFSWLNIITAQAYCLLTPLAVVLGIVGLLFKNDSKRLSWVALAVAVIPFLIILVQFVLALVKHN
ncbi:MAG: hypothetical protein HZB18_18005 [Chloroflexi bacterium]|nr:hypothetical protein [Chloroflexota bacterium]